MNIKDKLNLQFYEKYISLLKHLFVNLQKNVSSVITVRYVMLLHPGNQTIFIYYVK